MKIPKQRLYSQRANDLRAEMAGGVVADSPLNPAETDLIQDRKRLTGAFALTELLVAVAILAVMAVSLYGGISFSFANITLARQNLRATQIALEKMEIMRMYSWDQVNSNGFVPPTFTAPYYPTSGGSTNGGLTYYGTTTLTNVSINPVYDGSMRLVLVTLNWTNKNVKQSLSMSTYISQYGMQKYIY